MSQPTPYVKAFAFATYAANNQSAPFHASALDNELSNIEATLEDTLANLALIQRDDGELANGSVHPDALDQATLNLIGDWNPRGTWATGTLYSALDMVTNAGGTYVAHTEHVAGAAFAGDLALGYWQPVGGDTLGSLPATSISFTPFGGIGSTDVQAALEELDTEKMPKSGGTFTGAVTFSAAVTANAGITTNAATVTALTPNGMMYAGASGALASTGAPTDGQVLIGRTGLAPILGAVAGTANRVTVTLGAGTITLSGPQDIHSGATPTFAGVVTTGGAGIGTAISADRALGIAAAPSGVSQFGAVSILNASSGATALGAVHYAVAQTAVAAFTCPILIDYFADTLIKGAGSTITVAAGFYAANQNVGGSVSAGFYAAVNEDNATCFAFLAGGTAKSQFNGRVIFGHRFLGLQAVSVASANNLTLGNGNRFQITGTTQINLIDITDWQGGSEVTLHFQGAVTVAHNQAASGNFKPIMLSGSANFGATANDQLTLQYDLVDSKWYEKCRTVI